MSPPAPRTDMAFDASRAKVTHCDIAVARRRADGIELDLGQRLPAAEGGQQAELQHRLRLPLATARHLEDALARVLDAIQPPTQPPPAR